MMELQNTITFKKDGKPGHRFFLRAELRRRLYLKENKRRKYGREKNKN
jgi:hypothetical protein